MRLLGIHLFNDYSGSPLVFSEILKGLEDKDFDCEVITNKSQGFLSDLPNIEYNKIQYHWSSSKLKTLLLFLIAQWQIFWKVVGDREAQLIYINTILPFGAAIAGKLTGKKVVYHIHETSVKPALLKAFLFKVIEWTADQTIFVSNYLAEQEKIKGVKSKVVYNALPLKFSEIAIRSNQEKTSQGLLNIEQLNQDGFRVLMLCSLKDYKGINEFLSLSKYLPELEFDLVLNASETEINEWLMGKRTPENFHWYPVQSNVHSFYQKASLVLNLSIPDGWVETFGMTALEAMVYGLPVIVPPVGGIAELVQDKENGFHIDSRKVFDVAQQIEILSTDKKLYQSISKAAKIRASEFSIEKMIAEVFECLPTVQKVESYPSFGKELQLEVSSFNTLQNEK